MGISLYKPAAGEVDWFQPVDDGLAAIESALGSLVGTPGLFGDGSDGDVTISSDTTLTRDMCYDDLTVESPAVLTTNGFRIYAKGSVTIESGATVRHNGSDGVVGGGAGAASGSLQGGGDGGGFSPESTVASLGGDGGDDGGSGGTANPAPADYGGLRGVFQLLSGLYLNQDDNASVSGGAGGASGSGGGAGGGGVILIATPTLSHDGAIEAEGGDASNGGGGGGGVVLLLYLSRTGSGTVSVAGGSGGTGVGDGTILEVSV